MLVVMNALDLYGTLIPGKIVGWGPALAVQIGGEQRPPPWLFYPRLLSV